MDANQLQQQQQQQQPVAAAGGARPVQTRQSAASGAVLPPQNPAAQPPSRQMQQPAFGKPPQPPQQQQQQRRGGFPLGVQLQAVQLQEFDAIMTEVAAAQRAALHAYMERTQMQREAEELKRQVAEAHEFIESINELPEKVVQTALSAKEEAAEKMATIQRAIDRMKEADKIAEDLRAALSTCKTLTDIKAALPPDFQGISGLLKDVDAMMASDTQRLQFRVQMLEDVVNAEKLEFDQMSAKNEKELSVMLQDLSDDMKQEWDSVWKKQMEAIMSTGKYAPIGSEQQQQQQQQGESGSQSQPGSQTSVAAGGSEASLTEVLKAFHAFENDVIDKIRSEERNFGDLRARTEEKIASFEKQYMMDQKTQKELNTLANDIDEKVTESITQQRQRMNTLANDRQVLLESSESTATTLDSTVAMLSKSLGFLKTEGAQFEARASEAAKSVETKTGQSAELKKSVMETLNQWMKSIDDQNFAVEEGLKQDKEKLQDIEKQIADVTQQMRELPAVEDRDDIKEAKRSLEHEKQVRIALQVDLGKETEEIKTLERLITEEEAKIRVENQSAVEAKAKAEWRRRCAQVAANSDKEQEILLSGIRRLAAEVVDRMVRLIATPNHGASLASEYKNVENLIEVIEMTGYLRMKESRQIARVMQVLDVTRHTH